MRPPALPIPALGPVDRQFASLSRGAARDLIRPVALALATLYAIFSFAHLVLFEGPGGLFMATWASLTAAVFLTAGLRSQAGWLRKRPHVTLGGFTLLAISNALLHLGLTADPIQTTNLILIFLGAGALLFHGPTLLVILAVGSGGWLAVALGQGLARPEWTHYGFGLLSGTILALILFYAREQLLRKTAELAARGRSRESVLRSSQRRFKELFDASPGMVCLHDLGGVILDVNEAGVEAIGVPRGRLIGKNVGPFLLNNNREIPTEYLEKLARTGQATGLVTVEGSDGTIRRWKYRSTLLHDPEWGPYVVAAALDVTELEVVLEALDRAKAELEEKVTHRTQDLKEANRRLRRELEERTRIEEELRQKHKLEALGRLAGGIAHEFNNILTVLSGNLELALEEGQKGNPSLESLKEIHWASHRAGTLVSQILAFSRMNLGTHALFRATPFLEETLEALRRDLPEGVVLSSDIQEDLGQFRGSDSQLRQVLENLVANSCQSFPETGGTIHLQARSHRATPLEASRMDRQEGEECIRIQVSDNGRGIALSDQDRVFDPFFTTREVGESSGLGLSVAHGITRSHGGDISLESEPGRGTTVTLLFPSVPADPGQIPSNKPTGPETSGARVVVVDDEKAIARLVSRKLTVGGYEVKSFDSPREALEYVAANPRAVDLLLTDLSMPEIRGDELGTAIRKLRPGLPIVFMTGYGGFLDLATVAREGPTSILPKPFSGEGLVHAVEGVLRDAARNRTPSG